MELLIICLHDVFALNKKKSSCWEKKSWEVFLYNLSIHRYKIIIIYITLNLTNVNSCLKCTCYNIYIYVIKRDYIYQVYNIIYYPLKTNAQNLRRNLSLSFPLFHLFFSIFRFRWVHRNCYIKGKTWTEFSSNQTNI